MKSIVSISDSIDPSAVPLQGPFERENFLKTPILKALLDSQGRILVANEAFSLAFFGEVMDLKGHNFVKNIALSDQKFFLGLLERALSDQTLIDTSIDLSLVDSFGKRMGTEKYEFGLWVIRNLEGGVSCFSVWLRTAKEKRCLAQKKMQDLSQGKSSSFSRALCMAVDKNGFLTSFEGYQAENYEPCPVGIHYKQICSTRPEGQKRIERAMAGETFQVEVPYEGLWYHIWYTPVRDANGELAGATWTAWPSDNKKQQEFQLLKKLKEQEEESLLKEDLLCLASHEIRNPLGVLSLQLQSLGQHLGKGSDSGTLREKAKNIVEKGMAQVNRISLLAEKFLDSAAMSEKCFLPSPTTFDLVSMVNKIVSNYRRKYDLSANSLQVVAPPFISVHWDELSIEEVIENLLSNAIKYGKAPFSIQIELIDGQVVMELSDCGQGIKPEDQSRIFDRFVRTNQNKNIKGYGLGLYIVKKIVESHHGTIDIDSHLSIGTTFRIKIPASL